MSTNATLSAEVKERAGKGAARAMRRAGRVPAVIYGQKQDPLMISLDPIELRQLLRQHGFFSRIIEVDVAGSKNQVLARDVQFHPVTDVPMHVDFMRFSADTKVSVEIEVTFSSEAVCPGLKRGGVLNVVNHTIAVVCSPADMPESINIDLAELQIGGSVHLSDITLPEGVDPATDENLTIASITAPKGGADESEEAEGEEGEAEEAAADEEAEE